MKKLTAIAVSAAFLFGGFGSGYIYQEIAKPAIVEIYNTLNIVNGKTAYITLDGIGTGTYTDIRENLLYIQTMGIKDVHLTMCNNGGSVIEMWAIYDILYKATLFNSINLTTHAQGMIASAAVPIYLLGQKRTIGYNGFIMIHAHSGILVPYNAPTENDMLEQWTIHMIDIITNRTSMSRAKSLLHLTTGLDQKQDALYINAETALDYGFATKII